MKSIVLTAIFLTAMFTSPSSIKAKGCDYGTGSNILWNFFKELDTSLKGFVWKAYPDSEYGLGAMLDENANAKKKCDLFLSVDYQFLTTDQFFGLEDDDGNRAPASRVDAVMKKYFNRNRKPNIPTAKLHEFKGISLNFALPNILDLVLRKKPKVEAKPTPETPTPTPETKPAPTPTPATGVDSKTGQAKNGQQSPAKEPSKEEDKPVQALCDQDNPEKAKSYPTTVSLCKGSDVRLTIETGEVVIRQLKKPQITTYLACLRRKYDDETHAKQKEYKDCSDQDYARVPTLTLYQRKIISLADKGQLFIVSDDVLIAGMKLTVTFNKGARAGIDAEFIKSLDDASQTPNASFEAKKLKDGQYSLDIKEPFIFAKWGHNYDDIYWARDDYTKQVKKNK